jgi:hypothetical protein
MAHAVTSFHSADIPPDQLNAIMADYLAVERARIFRRLFVTRFSMLALGIVLVGAGLDLLPAFATWFSAGLSLAPPIWAWVVEVRCDRRLARRLERIPGDHTHVVPAPGS